ncbi:hypothetical protein [Roseiconus lacunae]|uniref:Uncharacterized protein n=1 Tax=Roseiconus lacunae TaxID=2605694 RepID=A0ABT7PCG5_9BACT|nr:hypothetical protein [Roseiconus lacunae]MDM4013931.1 hypothetical protein [Roseiconus lacunae]
MRFAGAGGLDTKLCGNRLGQQFAELANLDGRRVWVFEGVTFSSRTQFDQWGDHLKKLEIRGA